MINNTPGSKLDETVKSTLNNYEAQYDASDWSRMEQMLDAAPKSGNFKWSHAITVIAVLAVLGGGYALYSNFSKGTPKTEVTTAPPVTPANTPKEDPKASIPPPVASSPVISEPEKEEPPVSSPEKVIESPPLKSPEEKLAASEKVKVKKEKSPKKETSEPIIEAHDKVIGMGNEPVFGDMLDSSKGIIGSTKEKEEIKKAAKSKKGNVGWDIFTPHMNVDSMRKVREQRDSLKTQ
ncbi:MAG: hypothetical protein JWO09_3441 [Bacteroidetes bacterium]|nr:hypothetical protein [Bacteroidota bacterium]